MKIPDLKLWRNTFIFSLILFLLFSLYLFIRWHIFTIYILNKAFAELGLVLIAMSFMMSGFSYFFHINYLGYRKYLGLIGFYSGITHGIISSIFYLSGSMNFYQIFRPFDFPVSNVAAFGFGLLALMIFTMMAFISNKWAAKRLGKNWRRLLRVGYVAVFFVMVHFTIKKYSLWVSYSGLPPLSLFTLVFAFSVILLRIALYIRIKR